MRVKEGVLFVLMFGVWCQCALSNPVIVATDMNGTRVVERKEPWSVRHPRLHAVGRKTRKICQVSLPIVQFTGSAANTVMPFLRH